MSPSEFDLRAALRDGESEGGLDADRVIALGSARRAQRRARILSTAAAVVVVGALGTGGAFAFRDGGSDSAATKSSAGGAAAASSQGQADSRRVPSTADGVADRGQAGAASSVAAAPNASPAAGAACPAQYPRTLLPTGPATAGPLFARPVAYVVICSFGPPSAPHAPQRSVLTGSHATDLVDGLEHASTTPHYKPCPAILPQQQTSLAVIGVTADGTALPTVTTTLNSIACNLQATNGIAVRYDWQPPPDLLARLTTGPSPTEHGSPVR